MGVSIACRLVELSYVRAAAASMVGAVGWRRQSGERAMLLLLYGVAAACCVAAVLCRDVLCCAVLCCAMLSARFGCGCGTSTLLSIYDDAMQCDGLRSQHRGAEQTQQQRERAGN